MPPSETVAITPALKGGSPAPLSSRDFNPASKRSIRMQGVRQAGELKGRRTAQPEHCAQWQTFEIEPDEVQVQPPEHQGWPRLLLFDASQPAYELVEEAIREFLKLPKK